MKKLTHTDSKGKVKMVDVSNKSTTVRTASASTTVVLGKEIFLAVKANSIAKGDVLAAAKIAGIQAAKKTSELIPLCHNISLTNVDVRFKLNSRKTTLEITSDVSTSAQTGVEMEALTAAAASALTVYDMCKAMSKNIVIEKIRLLSKTGGKSGVYKFERRKNGR